MLTNTTCEELSSQLILSQSCRLILHFTYFLLPSLVQSRDLAIKPGIFSQYSAYLVLENLAVM